MGMSLDDDDYLPDFLKEDSVVESPFGLDDMEMPSDYEWPYLIDDFSVENILKLNKEGKNPNNTLTGIQWRALGKIKDNLYNWDNEPGFSDIFHKEFCKKYDISLSVLKALEKKGLIKLSKDDYYFKERGYIVYPKPLMYLVYISEQDYPDWFIPEAKEKGLWKAETFEATEWVGFCPECNKWRTKEMSKIFKNNRKDKNDEEYITDLVFNGWTIPKKLLGKQLCMRGQRFGNVRSQTDSFTGYGQRTHNDSYCGTPLTKVKSKYKSESFEAEFDFIHCSNCLFSKTGLNRCEVCNTEFVCRSQHGEDCNCYLFTAETFEAKGYEPNKPFYSTTREYPNLTTVMHPLHCSHHKKIANYGGTNAIWNDAIFYDTIEEMVEDNLELMIDTQWDGITEESEAEYNNLKTIGEARKFLKKWDFKLDFAPCFRKERNYDSKALNALPITVYPFWIDDGWADEYSDALREFQAETKKINPIEKAGISGVASGATIEGLETLMAAEEDEDEELSHEQLSAYFARLKDKNPDLAKEIEYSIKDESYLPTVEITNAGFDDEIIEAWVDLVGVEDENLQPYESCSTCEGEGYVLTSYTSATRFDPADGDGEDCEECGGTGMIDPADYMDKEGQYYAESFEEENNSWRKNAEYDMVKTSFKCYNIEYKYRRQSIEERHPDDSWPYMTVSVEHKENIEKYTLESLKDVIRAKLENKISFSHGEPVDVLFFSSERLEELQKKRLVKEFNNRGSINHQERWWAAETFNTEYDEEDMVYCNHCSDIVGNEKEVYGDETVEYEMANGELVCVPCYKIWMKEYKNDLDPHYSPFYAETESILKSPYLWGAGIFALTLGILSRKL